MKCVEWKKSCILQRIEAMENIVIVGFGGHGKSVADCIERQSKYRIVGYTDFQSHSDCKYAYLGTDAALGELYQSGVHNAAICIGYLGKGDVREKLYSKLKKTGYTMPIIIDPSAIISETAVLGEGTFVGKMAVINAEAEVGKMAIINTKALVEHDCKIGDYTHIAVSAVLCGEVSVGQASFVGANSTIIQSRKLGDRVIVGAGSVVTKDIENGRLFRNAFGAVVEDN